ncbi:MAG TPA: MBL fold metallo-hydrolase [Magnetospirillaceae bacterium]|nr:MBL fold metallo-hydrolase [Magnetospirillaceae bacterium]
MKVFFHYSLYGFSNVYLVGGDAGGEAILIDPAEFTENLLDFIERNGYYVRAVLITHNHIHHVRGLSTLRKLYDAEVFSSNAEVRDTLCTVLHDGDVLDVCGVRVEAISVPGHSSDSIVYKVDKLLFTGDTLGAGMIGHTLSRYGNALLRAGIERRILSQEEDCIILPGHGPPSTVGAERLFNLGMTEGTATGFQPNRYELFV